MRTFGEHIKELRKRKGMTQRELAAASGISNGHIVQLENDKAPATKRIAINLASPLGVSPALMAELAFLYHDLKRLKEKYTEFPQIVSKIVKLEAASGNSDDAA